MLIIFGPSWRVGQSITIPALRRAGDARLSLPESAFAAFGQDAIWAFKPTREGNTVVLAQRNASRPKRPALAERAQTIQTRWRLPAPKWLRVFKPHEAKT